MKWMLFLACILGALAGCEDVGHSRVEAIAKVVTSEDSGADVSLTQSDSHSEDTHDVLVVADEGVMDDTQPDLGGGNSDITEIAEIEDSVDGGSDAAPDVFEAKIDTEPEITVIDVQADATAVEDTTVEIVEDADAGPVLDVVLMLDSATDSADVDASNVDTFEAISAIDATPTTLDSGPDAEDVATGTDSVDTPDSSEVSQVDVVVNPCANKNCEDGNTCTSDSCDSAKGCIHVNLNVVCEDGNVCTVGDSCSAGACVPGAAKDCSDGNVCTLDQCDATTGCSNPLATPTYAEDWNTFTSKDDTSATQLGQGWSGTGLWSMKCGGFPYGQGAVFTGCTTWYGDNNITGEVHVQHGLTGVGTARTLQLDVQRIGNDPQSTLTEGIRFFDAKGGVISTVPFSSAFPAKEFDPYKRFWVSAPSDATSFELYVKRTADWEVQVFYGYSVRFDNIKVWPFESATAEKCFP